MFNTPIVAGIILFVFYAVSVTKGFFDGIAQPGKDKAGNPTPGNPGLQASVVRLWAILLGVVGAVVDGHFGSNLSFNGAPMYEAIKNGAIGGVGAILTYHVGNGDFISAFGKDTPVLGLSPITTVTVAGAPIVTEAPKVTVTQSPPAAQIISGNWPPGTVIAGEPVVFAPTPLPTPPALPDPAPVDAGS